MQSFSHRQQSGSGKRKLDPQFQQHRWGMWWKSLISSYFLSTFLLFWTFLLPQRFLQCLSILKELLSHSQVVAIFALLSCCLLFGNILLSRLTGKQRPWFGANSLDREALLIFWHRKFRWFRCPQIPIQRWKQVKRQSQMHTFAHLPRSNTRCIGCISILLKVADPEPEVPLVS